MTNPTEKLLIVSVCVVVLLGLSGAIVPVQAQLGDDDPLTATAEFLGGVFAATAGNQGGQNAPPPPPPDPASSPSPGALTTSPSKPPTAHQLHEQGVFTVDDFFGLFQSKPDPGSQSPSAAGPPASSPPSAGAPPPTVIPPPPGSAPSQAGSSPPAPLSLNNVTGYGYDPAGGRVIVTRGDGWPQEYKIPPGGVQINWGSGIEGPPDHLPGSHQQSGGPGGSTSGGSPPGLGGSGQGQQASTGATTAPGG